MIWAELPEINVVDGITSLKIIFNTRSLTTHTMYTFLLQRMLVGFHSGATEGPKFERGPCPLASP